MDNRHTYLGTLIACILTLSGCASSPVQLQKEEAVQAPPTQFKRPFPEPEIGRPIVVAVYSFTDKTGQRKDSGNIAKLSSAVTQGAESLLLKSLADVGDGKWFRIVERVGLDNLLKERQLIRSSREEAEEKTPLRPILYAGMIIEGSIVSYDTNQRTGGFGVRILGIGPSTQYQEDVVTVSLRAVNVQTGEVILTVNTQKTILSVATSLSIFKFYDAGTKSFENEIGSTATEPGVYAVKAAIDLAVEELVYQGEKKDLWKFRNPNVSTPLIIEPVSVKEEPLPSVVIKEVKEPLPSVVIKEEPLKEVEEPLPSVVIKEEPLKEVEEPLPSVVIKEEETKFISMDSTPKYFNKEEVK